MGERFTAQAEEIQAICQRMEMDLPELAEHAGMKPETLRKYAGGYQKASEGTMQNLRRVEQMHSLIKESAASAPKESSPFRFVATDTLEQNIIDMVMRLRKCAPNERKHIIGNLSEAISEIEQRELMSSSAQGKSGSGESPGTPGSPHHGKPPESEGGKPGGAPHHQGYRRSGRAALHSGSITGPSSAVGKH